MKRFLLLLILLLLPVVMFSTAFDHIISGEYAFFEDKRGGMNFIRGYCCFKVEGGTVAFLIKNINLKTKKEINFMATMDTDEKGLPIIKDIKGLDEKTPPEFIQSYIDILNYITLYLNHKAEIKYDTVIEDKWEDYSLFFNFNGIIPLFRFNTITKDKETVSKYTFLKGGILNPDNYMDFFKIDPIIKYTKDKTNNAPLIDKIEKVNVKINGVSIDLDNRWVSNFSLGSPGYWFQFKNIRDSQIMVERAEWKKFENMGTRNLDEFILRAIYFNQNILPETIKVEMIKDELHVEYKVIDERKTLNYSKLILIRKKADLLIINFSTFDSIYQKNPEYYNDIFKSIKIEN